MDISVIIPTYNRYEYLLRALESVYTQSYSPKEVIVVDDGSSDATPNIVKQFPDLKYIYQDNRGVSAARNVGVKHSDYGWIAFLDSDDAWHKDKLATQVEYHQKNRDILISYTDERWIRDEVELKVPKKYQKPAHGSFEDFLSHCIIAPSSVLLHKELFLDAGGFDESLEVCEDYALWLHITSKEKIALIDQKLITKYAGHEDQLSFKYWGMDRFRVQALESLLVQLRCENQKQKVVQTLHKKYTLLLQGAKKHNKTAAIKDYESKVVKYSFL